MFTSAFSSMSGVNVLTEVFIIKERLYQLLMAFLISGLSNRHLVPLAVRNTHGAF